MIHWEKRLNEVPPPSTPIVVLTLMFIILIFFMLSSNFIFLPGIKTSATLPELPGAEIIQANKLIITVSYEIDKSTQKIIPDKFIYTFNGMDAVHSLDELMKEINETLDNANKESSNTTAENKSDENKTTEPIIILHADKEIPLQELVNCYSRLRECNATIALATDFEKKESQTRIQQVKEH